MYICPKCKGAIDLEKKQCTVCGQKVEFKPKNDPELDNASKTKEQFENENAEFIEVDAITKTADNDNTISVSYQNFTYGEATLYTYFEIMRIINMVLLVLGIVASIAGAVLFFVN